MKEPKVTTILHVIGGMNRGGAETFLMNVLRNIDRNNVKFVFLCYGNLDFDYQEEILRLGARIIRIADVKDRGILQHINDIRKIIRDNSVDVVHAHTYYNSVFSLISARLSGVKLRIAHSHNTRSESRPGFLKKLYFSISGVLIKRYANQYIACGQDAGYALFGKKANFKVINNGINIQDFTYDVDKRSEIRNEWKLKSENTKVVLHVGRFETQKNHIFLIDIFAKYNEKNQDSVLILIGDGPLREDVMKKIYEKKLENSVKYLGKRSDVNAIYSAADLFVFPSLFEGLPVVLVEVQANGLYALVSDAIDRQAKLTSWMIFKSIDSSPESWARALGKIKPNKNRNQVGSTMLGGAYDISHVTLEVLQLYRIRSEK